MLRIIGRQCTRNLTKCSSLAQFALKQKHISASIQTNVRNNRQSTLQDIKDIPNPILDIPSTQLAEIVDSSERLVELPLIKVGDYVEAFR